MSPAQVLAFGMPGAAEWVVIMIIGLLLFGRRLPEIMRGLGSSVREFRSGMEGQPGGADDRPRDPPAAHSRPSGETDRPAGD